MPELAAPNPNYRTPPSIIAAIIGISALASIFLAWLVYYHPPVDAAGTHLTFLPALDAILNALCAISINSGASTPGSTPITGSFVPVRTPSSATLYTLECSPWCWARDRCSLNGRR